MLDKLKVYLRSDTVKTVTILFLLNGFQGLFPILPDVVVQIANLVLPLIAGYFRINLKTAL